MEEERETRVGRLGGLDPSPLLHHIIGRTTSSAALFFGGASPPAPSPSGDPFSDASAADDRPPDSGYSKPLLILDVIWNISFVLVSIVVLLSTLRERPSTPLRVWIVGYAAQCLIHVGLVCYEFEKRRSAAYAEDGCARDDEENQGLRSSDGLDRSITKRLESMNTMGSFFWWVMGFYWIVLGGHALLQDAPRLYWLAVVFLAFDVFFAVFCVTLACIVGFALCCCLPCILAILYAVAVYAVAVQGASDDDIRVLPRYRFRHSDQRWTSHLDKKQEVRVPIMETGSNESSEIFLPSEDSECCICLSQYVDGVELQSLPCNHHFHSECIAKWLRINATCPLCKYNILHGDELV